MKAEQPWRWLLGLPGRAALALGGLALGALVWQAWPRSGGPVATPPAPTAAPTSAPALAPSATPARPPTATPTTASSATPASLPAQMTDAHSIAMVLVPAGPFEMGGDVDVALAERRKLYIGGDCRRSYFVHEEPKHTVTLNDYYIDQYEVTNAAYQGPAGGRACAARHLRPVPTRAAASVSDFSLGFRCARSP